ncbi:MAG: DsbA family protein, partial [Methylobacter sp.]
MVTTLFYIHDPMCSWCYAFDSSLTALQKELPDFIKIKKIIGGLAPDTTIPMPVELQQNIQQTWRRIEQTVSTIQFNYDFWIINTPVRSTYHACRAILAARQQGADFENKKIGAIQIAYYQKAKNPSLQSTLLHCALEVGLAVVK